LAAPSHSPRNPLRPIARSMHRPQIQPFNPAIQAGRSSRAFFSPPCLSSSQKDRESKLVRMHMILRVRCGEGGSDHRRYVYPHFVSGLCWFNSTASLILCGVYTDVLPTLNIYPYLCFANAVQLAFYPSQCSVHAPGQSICFG
jgi:hypothetical protein